MRRRLAGAVDADDHDHGRRVLADRERALERREQLGDRIGQQRLHGRRRRSAPARFTRCFRSSSRYLGRLERRRRPAAARPRAPRTARRRSRAAGEDLRDARAGLAQAAAQAWRASAPRLGGVGRRRGVGSAATSRSGARARCRRLFDRRRRGRAAQRRARCANARPAAPRPACRPLDPFRRPASTEVDVSASACRRQPSIVPSGRAGAPMCRARRSAGPSGAGAGGVETGGGAGAGSGAGFLRKKLNMRGDGGALRSAARKGVGVIRRAEPLAILVGSGALAQSVRATES